MVLASKLVPLEQPCLRRMGALAFVRLQCLSFGCTILNIFSQLVALLVAPASEHRHFASPAMTTNLHRTANAFLLVLSGHSLPPVLASLAIQIVPLVQAVVHLTNARLVLKVDQSCLMDDVSLLAPRTSSSIGLAGHVKSATIPAQAVRMQVPQIV